MRDIRFELLACLILAAAQASLHAQLPGTAPAPASPTSSAADARSAELERKLEDISSALAATHKQFEQSQQELEQLRQELAQIKKQLALAQPAPGELSSSATTADAAKETAAAIEGLQEQQQTTEAQVKVHDQTKVESGSKYPLRVTGLILFNAFINRGSVDNIDLPEAALSNQNNTTGNGSAGASFRQTVLGLEGFGPRIAGARTSANVDLDFFGGNDETSSW